MIYIPPPLPPVVVTFTDEVDCGGVGPYAGCTTAPYTVTLDSALLDNVLFDWVLAHEAAHAVLGANECQADDYAYMMTDNETMYRAGSPYAERCGHAGTYTPGAPTQPSHYTVDYIYEPTSPSAPTTPATPSSPRIEEDDPRWNCNTMGNRECAPTI